MRKVSRTLIPLLLMIALAIGGVLYLSFKNSQENRTLVVSGTIEVRKIKLSTQMGGIVDQLYLEEGQHVQKDQVVAMIQPASGVQAGYTEKVRCPIDGVVLEKSYEQGELALAGATLLTIGDLSKPTLTVYVPEDRYGKINLGQGYPVTVDSFPGRVFTGTVSYISDQAEFTPRNVQTAQGRKDTVYAVKLSLENPDLALKPGMPADVTIELK
jgi:multidrug efflux pump subunit AcrA (membrane-fusion protein)